MVALPLPNLPADLSALRTLALDLRWTWSHEADTLWEEVQPELWRRTCNPWIILQNASPARLQMLSEDSAFRAKLRGFMAAREAYHRKPGWFAENGYSEQLNKTAYFSMEFGLGAALPLYAGGLGVLAGDFLKTASDLGVPAIGVGLLYQEGYFRQIVNTAGMQQELYPYNEPATLPIEPVLHENGGWLRIPLELPGRVVLLRVWQANVGRVKLYLLDSNDPLNTPADRGITAKLYGGGPEIRLMQEIALGIGGWRVIEELHRDVEICHINEGHAAFAIIERAHQFAKRSKLSFWEALWATRAGNVFTTHTPVAAGFDAFPTHLLRTYLPYPEADLLRRGVTLEALIGLGRIEPQNAHEPFNMAWLAQRGSAACLGVSRLHGDFSRQIFQPLFPRWPACEVPVGHITNGVHMPTWDSVDADRIWTEGCGKERWRGMPAYLGQQIARTDDESLWAMRGEQRQRLVRVVRGQLATQLRERGFSRDAIGQAGSVLDPNILTLAFARRFTEYKRPNLLLRDRQRLERLLLDEKQPVQIVVAGKAHPADREGKEMIRAWIALARDPRFRRRVVFLEDYDIAIAKELVQGADVWINTPRRPWEACGTSGMKVLVNGGLNCSILDGWWAEAHEESLGWSIGDATGGPASEVDERDAASLFDTLEKRVVPEFYNRDADGLPRDWLARVRRSMSVLTPAFASSRMMLEYIEKAYLPLAAGLRLRLADNCSVAKALFRWSECLRRGWPSLHIGHPTILHSDGRFRFSVPVFLGEVQPDFVRVELFADEINGLSAEVITLYQEQAIPGAAHGYVYAGEVAGTRAAEEYTLRVVPWHEAVQIPAELPLIAWQQR
ncbi:MAG TPA: alpha-glucan family phosphorylase [Rhizomicrobium sp.]|jgi:starch phosphorylase|nr:alpha-glucan family phosphorylase [Rhizomicrobium sp.]